MVAKADVCFESGVQIRESYLAMPDRDQRRACVVERRLNRRLHRGEFQSVDDVRSDAEAVKFLRRAEDPRAAGEWLDKIIALIERLIPLFIK